jgi:hypothetical protein
MMSEIASFTGGQDRPDVLAQARQAIFEAIRSFNAWAWTFNRVTEDITLSSPNSGTDADYSLSENWRSPLRAQLVDSDGKTREHVEWIQWAIWVTELPDQSTTGSTPLYYTARNIHETGVVTVDPPPATADLTYPTMRLFYHRRILCPSDNTAINVPTEVEQAIFDEAVWRFLRKKKTFKEARDAKQAALVSKSEIQFEYRDFEDYHGA